MSVYRITDRAFESLEETSFEAQNIYERRDLQRMLRNQPDVLEQDLFIVAEEYGDWEESNRRIDLLALDGKGRLVVIELKRSDLDSLMDLQAIRYAAMVANMTLEQAIDAHREDNGNRGIDEDADSRIRSHLATDDDEVRIHTSNPRIILVSANFSKELTTSVLWLNQRGLEITCIRLQPYKAEGALFLEKSQVIPIPEATDYLVRLRDKEKEAESQKPSAAETFVGGDAFRDAIETANEDYKNFLETLYQLGVSLEQAELASLSTTVGSYNTVLRIRFPNSTRGLVNIYKNQPGNGYIQFKGSSFDNHAPESKQQINRLISPQVIGPISTLWEFPEGFIDALRDAYREAKGEV